MNKPLFWVDMEMTGLNILKDQIIEIACALTDQTLAKVIEGPNLIIHADKTVLDAMDDWCTKTHTASGLFQKSLHSKVSVKEAEALVLQFLKDNNIPPKSIPMAGNTISMDRLFVQFHMPQLSEFLHYQVVDVSSVKLLCNRWNTKVYEKLPKKQGSHRAYDDIMESIDELRYYQRHFMICK